MGKLTDVLRLWRFPKSVSALLIQTSFTEGKAVIIKIKLCELEFSVVMQRRKQSEQSLQN
jgi:hypothetical protein